MLVTSAGTAYSMPAEELGAKAAVEDDHYQILGVIPSADIAVIRAAYRALAQKYHPDVNQSAHASAMMVRINQAYAVLGDEVKRSQYDASRNAPPPPKMHPTPPKPAAAPAQGEKRRGRSAVWMITAFIMAAVAGLLLTVRFGVELGAVARQADTPAATSPALETTPPAEPATIAAATPVSDPLQPEPARFPEDSVLQEHAGLLDCIADGAYFGRLSWSETREGHAAVKVNGSDVEGKFDREWAPASNTIVSTLSLQWNGDTISLSDNGTLSTGTGGRGYCRVASSTLLFTDLTASINEIHGQRTLVIHGWVVNGGNQAQVVPDLSFRVVDRQGNILQALELAAPSPELQAGQSAGFSGTVRDPPPDMHEVIPDFSTTGL